MPYCSRRLVASEFAGRSGSFAAIGSLSDLNDMP